MSVQFSCSNICLYHCILSITRNVELDKCAMSNVVSDDQQCLVIPWDRHHRSVTSLHHNAIPPCHWPSAPPQICLIWWPVTTHLESPRDSRRSSRPGWRSPARQWTSRTSPCDSLHWGCPIFGIGAEKKLFNFLHQKGFVSLGITSFLHQHTVKMSTLSS